MGTKLLCTAVVEADLTEIKKMNLDDIEIITEDMSSICVDEISLFVCGCGFKSAGYLANHKKKHGEVLKPFLCEECDKILKSKRNLEDHIRKMHRTCKHCAEIFENAGQLELHRREHTTCVICDVDMRTKYKLERHMNTHKN